MSPKIWQPSWLILLWSRVLVVLLRLPDFFVLDPVTPSSVVALQQFNLGVKLLARPHSSHRQASLWRESLGGAR
ncbi:MAG: hypothetical protein HC773_09195 [Scytonema sp. CRU_2_7]|nr:hypothetical protein [Scytonema sp. CRU_2_7]